MSEREQVAEVHGPRSPRWHGNPRQYQIEAQARYAVAHDRAVLPWSYVTTDCEVPQCLEPACMTVHTALRIEYPRNVCVYCGEGGYTQDHLMPEPMTGKALRALVAVVPACGSCNGTINDKPTWNVAARRRIAQLAIERKHKHLLARPRKTDAEMRALGTALRSVAVKNNILADRVKARLAWPLDPFYDLRAFQRAGIEDPESLGLCDAEATPLRPEYQEAA